LTDKVYARHVVQYTLIHETRVKGALNDDDVAGNIRQSLLRGREHAAAPARHPLAGASGMAVQLDSSKTRLESAHGFSA
jgi:hypothetical protein